MNAVTRDRTFQARPAEQAVNIDPSSPKPPVPLLPSGSRREAFAIYLFATLVCLATLTMVMRLWRADWHVPFCGGYWNDGLAISTMIKGEIEHGWYLHNPSVGTPDGFDMNDYPMTDNLHFAAFKVLALFSHDYAVIYNFYFLLTFPLTTLLSLAAFRQFRLGWLPSIAGSVLFTFLPYHFFRGATGHLFLSAYYFVPLVMMICLWIYRDGSLLRSDRTGPQGRWRVLRRPVGAVVIALLLSAGAVYYSFFACFLLMMTGAAASWWHRRLAPLGWACLLIGCISAGTVLNLMPTFVYQHAHGRNVEAGVRKPAEAEYYGLKLTQLLLPVCGHRVPFLAHVKESYLAQAMPVGPESFSTLGFVGVAGFLMLLGVLLPRRGIASGPPLLGALAVLNVFSLLLAAVGGGSSLFALFVTPQIRCYERICVFIGFSSFFAVVWLFDRLLARWGGSPAGRWSVGALIVFVTTLGVLDQTGNTPTFVPMYADLKQRFTNDANFVERMEARLPAGSLIFQLPYQTYPEAGPVQRLSDYDLFRGYLHSRTLRWTYGSIRGRDGDRWLQVLASQSPEQLARTLAFAEFGGIYLDRRGYPIGDTSVETALAHTLEIAPLESADHNLVFFDLTAYRDRLRRQYTDAEWTHRHDRALHPVLLTWEHGFYAPEGAGRWCEEVGEVMLRNPSQESRKVHLEVKCLTSFPTPARLTVSGELAQTENSVNLDGRTISLDLCVPPGRHVLQFACDGKKIKPGDGRTLVFNVYGWRLSEEE